MSELLVEQVNVYMWKKDSKQLRFCKNYFLTEFFLKEFLKCIVTFIKFMCFPNNQSMFICGQVRVGEIVRVVIVSAALEGTWSCSVSQLGDTRGGLRDVLHWVWANQQLLERVLLLPAEAQLLSLHINHFNMKEKCFSFSDYQCLLHREQHLLRVSTHWLTTSSVLGHCSTRVTVTRDEDR